MLVSKYSAYSFLSLIIKKKGTEVFTGPALANSRAVRQPTRLLLPAVRPLIAFKIAKDELLFSSVSSQMTCACFGMWNVLLTFAPLPFADHQENLSPTTLNLAECKCAWAGAALSFRVALDSPKWCHVI